MGWAMVFTGLMADHNQTTSFWKLSSNTQVVNIKVFILCGSDSRLNLEHPSFLNTLRIQGKKKKREMPRNFYLHFLSLHQGTGD